MNQYLWRMRACLLVLGLGLLIGATDRGWTQQQKTIQGLTRPYDATATRRNELMAGKVDFPTPEDKKIAQIAAEFLIYRIQLNAADKPTPAWKSHLSIVQSDFEKAVNFVLEKKDANRTMFIKVWMPHLVASMKDVLSRDMLESPTVVINACMMLPTMARLKQDDINDYLISLASDDKQNEIIRMYAIKALKEYMPIRPFEEDEFDAKNTLAKKKRDIKVVEALTNYIKRPIKAELKPEEIAAARYLRREAIMTLAHAGLPAVNIAEKTKEIEGPIAPMLVQVIAGGGLQPAPTLQEKIEAAMGLCAVKHAKMPEYQSELAVFCVGQTFGELLSEYSKDFANFAAKGTTRKLPMVAWKHESKRFEKGLEELAANARGTKGKALADRLEKGARPVLSNLSKYQQLDNEKFQEFMEVVRSKQPKSAKVFETPNAPVVKFSALEQ